MDRSVPSPTTALVGRDRERGLLSALLDETEAGRACTVLVHGEAGVGKTSLVRAVTEARTEGVALYGAGLPLSSLTVPLLAIRSLVRELPDDVPPLDLPNGHDAADALVSIDAWLDRLAETRPVALVVDDLHWADQTSLDVLQYVVAGPERRRLSIMATVRSGAVTDEHPLTRWLADVRRLPRVEEIELAPLDRASTLDQLTSLLGETPHGSLVGEVYARAGGNPYFTRLLATGLRSDARHLPTAMPGSLHDALLRTSSTLSASARRGTQTLAVGGHPATYDELDDVAPDLRWDEIVPEAVAAGVVDALPAGRFWIHHPLLAETMEAEMPGRERRARHRVFAQWWERQPPLHEETAEAARVALVADHYFQAQDTDHARTWALRAAEAAESAGAWSEAHRLLERELTHDSSDGRDDTRLGLLHRARAAAEMSGDLDAELALVDELMTCVDPATDPLAVADLIVRRASVRHLTGRTYVDDDALEAAETLARSQPPSATLVRTLAWSAMHGDWEPAKCAALSEEAVMIAHEIGAAVGMALTAKSVTAFVGDDATASIACAGEAVAASMREGDWPSAARSAEYRTCAGDSAWSPWFAEQIARDREHLAASGAPRHEIVLFDILEADARLWIGEWEECVAILRSCMATRLQPMWDAGGRLSLAHLAAGQGRHEEAASHLARAEELVVDTQSFYELEFDAVRALVALAAADPEAAYSHAVAGLGFDTLPPSMIEYLLPLAVRALADQIERRRAAGEGTDDLLRMLTELAATHRHIVLDIGEMQPWVAAQIEAIQVLYRAELARAMSSPDAPLLWRVTTIRARRAHLRWDEAYAGWRWAEALLRSGDHGRETNGILRDAHVLASRLGAVPVIDALERLAASAHISLAEVVGEPAGTWADGALPGLTPRENEIVAHLVAGRTYAEIADALVISEKTVSSHVSNILRKSGAKNRVELAVLAQHRVGP
ncbi:AAA family ATPase [Mumia sp. zg.B21]|uniref:helix-turn-helix transcriptional regulator n=1 Tax=Mumia sp. zg.B21 TaxID=2855447 RepID=UPI001C6F331C|nr:LuxR family transcriptional regulator [Mumia sp. zg.B21]MBW9211611.1 AAA family ATPase [Mumia sp. zg.B21]